MNLDHVYVALDRMDRAEVEDFLLRFPQIRSIKIGLELFCRFGPEIVSSLSLKGHRNIFLDLKLHDIPHTVEKAVESLSGLPIQFLTIHLQGGMEMIKAAIRAADIHLPNCTLLGVSYLTSLGQEELQQIYGACKFNDQLTHLVRLALASGLKGLVCSAQDLTIIDSIDPKHQLKRICPGIRFNDDPTQDQKRTLTPEKAIESGVDFLVLGRSLTQSPNALKRLEMLSKLRAK